MKATLSLLFFILLQPFLMQSIETVYCEVNYRDLDHFLKIGPCKMSFDEAILFRVFLGTSTPQTFGGCTFENKGNRKFKINGKRYEFSNYYFSMLKIAIDNVFHIKFVHMYFYGRNKELKGFSYKEFTSVVSKNQTFRVESYFVLLSDTSCFLQVNSVTVHLNKTRMIALQKAMEDVETGKRSYQGFDYTDITYPRKQIHQFFVRLQTGKDGRSLIYFQSEFSKNPLPEEIETMLLRKNGSLPDYLQNNSSAIASVYDRMENNIKK